MWPLVVTDSAESKKLILLLGYLASTKTRRAIPENSDKVAFLELEFDHSLSARILLYGCVDVQPARAIQLLTAGFSTWLGGYLCICPLGPNRSPT
jgi:hypothetical protein